MVKDLDQSDVDRDGQRMAEWQQMADDFDEVLTALKWMVIQHCGVRDDKNLFDSGAITANAEAIHLLGKHGVMTTNGAFRMITGRLVEEP